MAENTNKVSHEWTEDDRLTVIAHVALRLREGKIHPQAAAETIIFVVIKTPKDLEVNRKQIMEDAGMEP
jgi:hypothetical protein